jgi:DNA mismatch repair protein MutL
MEMTIHQLSDSTINRIAAGEVIERPFSVVRELVENSIDAGATEISVRLEQGGIGLIRVRDNGKGIASNELSLAFARHATSKIREAGDLDRISSLGFRGEALAAISSVAQVTVYTRPEEEEVASGLRVFAERSEVLSPKAMSRGTEMLVQGLFEKIPVRRKFLKSERAERQKIKQWLTETAIAHWAIRFELLEDEKRLLSLPGMSSQDERARNIYPGNLLAAHYHKEGFELNSLISLPGDSAKKKGALVTLVNGRVVRDNMLSRSVKDAYGMSLKSYEHPRGYLALSMDPESVDVNVHPQKSEVRFRNPSEVYLRTRRAIERAFEQSGSGRESEVSHSIEQKALSAYEESPRTFVSGQEQRPFEFSSSRSASAIPKLVSAGNAESVSCESEKKFRYNTLRYIGQVMDCFLLCEREKRFIVIDMHAAHERCRYNEVLLSLEQEGLKSVRLLVPLSIELSEEQHLACVEQRTLLEALGFAFEEFGENSLLLRERPYFVSDGAAQRLFEEVGSEIESGDLTDHLVRTLQTRVAAIIACHSSVRSGDKLKSEEVYALFEMLDRTHTNLFCPHGRPLVKEFERTEVEKWFGRP